jgi:hypothetical protein
MTDRWWWRGVGWVGAGFPADPSPVATRSCAPKKRKLNASFFFLKNKTCFSTSFSPKNYLLKFLASHSPFSNPHLSFLFLKLTGEERMDVKRGGGRCKIYCFLEKC